MSGRNETTMAAKKQVNQTRRRAAESGGKRRNAGKKPAKKYSEMTKRELARATKEFDREFIADTFGPMNDKDRDRWERAKRKRGRPVVGQGAQVISVSIEKSLLIRANDLAARMGVSRAKLISLGLERMLKSRR